MVSPPLEFYLLLLLIALTCIALFTTTIWWISLIRRLF